MVNVWWPVQPCTLLCCFILSWRDTCTLHLSKQLENSVSQTLQYLLMVQQPLVGQDLLHNRGFMFTLRHTTLGRTPLDEWSARCRDLYLTIHDTHNRQTSMPPVGFKTAIPASKQLHNHAFGCAATLISTDFIIPEYNSCTNFFSVFTDSTP